MFLQVLGEHRREKSEDGKPVYELGLRLYDPARRNQAKVRFADDETRNWLGPYKIAQVWLVNLSDVIKELHLVKEEKITASRSIFYFTNVK